MKPLLQQAWRVSEPVALFFDLVFPPRCAGCGRVDTDWCVQCDEAIQQIPIHDTTSAIFPPFTALATTSEHTGKLQRVIQALKYENAKQLAFPLSQRLTHRITELGWIVDGIVPVPLHQHRLRERGYNQAEQIAQHTASQLGLPCYTDMLLKVRHTRSQVGLNYTARQTNVANAFEANPTHATGKTLLLIDDVLTTGATLAACATTLLEGGAVEVYGLTVTAAVSSI